MVAEDGKGIEANTSCVFGQWKTASVYEEHDSPQSMKFSSRN